MSGRLGVHALVWVGGWSREECERAVAATAEAGYDLIEIPLLDPATVDAGHTRAVLRDHGIGAACSLGLNAATDVSGEDEAAVAAGRALLHDALAVAGAVGADYLGGVVYGALGRYTAPPTPRGRENAVTTIRELAARAEDHGIVVGLETVNRYETNLLNTAEQTLAFLDEVGAPNVRVHLDTYHMHIEEADMTAPVLACGDRLGYFHVGESHRGPLGTGNVDWPQVFAALERSGYAGDVAFESFSSAVVAPELSSTLCVWRELWDDGMALARDARRFVEDGRATAARAAA